MTIAHYELNTSDPEKAKTFYKSIFGWKYQDMPMPDGTYTMVTSKDGPIGGIQKNSMKGAPSHWLGYLTVASVDRTTTKVKKAGGKVLVPKIIVPGMGTYAVYADPTGGLFGVWAAATKTATKSTKKSKKRSTKKSGKKTTKKRSTKKSTKKRSTKKRSTDESKKTSKKRSTKKTTKKRSTKKTPKKTSKKRSTKKTTKKSSKKRSAKKHAKKRRR